MALSINSVVVVLAVILVLVGAPPVDKKKKADAENQNKANEVPEDSDVKEWSNVELEYKRYLQEVVSVLEEDPEFRKKLEEADPEAIRSGQVVEHLPLVAKQVRTQLDELKRQELERLRHLAMKRYEESNGMDTRHMKIPSHLDVNKDGFHEEDLLKLIKSTTQDLEAADLKRREEFKRYEMEKQFKFDEEMRKAKTDEEKKALKDKHEQDMKHHKEHPKVHHPGSKAQLEEAWEKQDHMDPSNFDIRTLFMMHDIDGNGFLDENELKVLFFNELQKVYDPNDTADDPRERDEELERMREHVFAETDKNKDRLLSLEEFMLMTQQPDWQEDPGWDGLDDQNFYTDQELEEYERLRRQQLGIDHGIPVDLPHPNAIDHGYAPGMGHPPPIDHPAAQGYHPGQGQQQYQQHPGQQQQYQQHQGQQQQYQQHQGQQQQYQQHHDQQQQYQQHQGQQQYQQHQGQQQQYQQHQGQQQQYQQHQGQQQQYQQQQGQQQHHEQQKQEEHHEEEVQEHHEEQAQEQHPPAKSSNDPPQRKIPADHPPAKEVAPGFHVPAAEEHHEEVNDEIAPGIHRGPPPIKKNTIDKNPRADPNSVHSNSIKH